MYDGDSARVGETVQVEHIGKGRTDKDGTLGLVIPITQKLTEQAARNNGTLNLSVEAAGFVGPRSATEPMLTASYGLPVVLASGTTATVDLVLS